MAIKAPNVIFSYCSSIKADFPTNFLLPFLAQIIISFLLTFNFGSTKQETLTISVRSNLPFLILDDLNTIVSLIF